MGPIILTLLAATALSQFSSAADTPFSYESIQLRPSDLTSLSPSLSKLVSFGNASDPSAASASRKLSSTGCKVFPGDKEWPSDDTWGEFNKTLRGALIKTVPIASSCYSGWGYNKTRCDFLLANWADSTIHELDPTSYMSPLYQGNTCPPTANPNGTCTLGGFPSYVVNATTVKQIQLAVNFARNTGIRLTVKNTGHEFSGKTGGAGALSVWTHYLNDILYLPKLDDEVQKYSGPAFKGGSGVIAKDLTGCWGFGGYIAGGGHSPMSPIYGMAADQVLSMNLVTPDGQFVTASSTENTDLFWALRGSGGSTWGVVTSVTIRAHPGTPVTVVKFDLTASTSKTFWLGMKAYWKHFIEYSDAGIYSYFFIFDMPPVPFMQMVGFWAPNKTKEETAALLKPWFADLAALKMNVNASYVMYPTAYPAFINTFPLEAVGGDQIVGSRLFPRESFKDPNSAIFNKTFDAWSTTNSSMLISFNIAARNVHNVSNAVLPAWRETVMHTIMGVGFPNAAASTAEKRAARDGVTKSMKKWREVSPGAGAYLGEADIEEENWQTNFYGSNYKKLVSIKKIVDPWDLFWSRTGVGSEVAKVKTGDVLQNENGPLCWT
ncbi:hypothetical protein B0J14DRAFT_603629 [Halenospora varia]|nr:hypothetical protein B0J14DRAFT_603629 [Halenospora varia]